MCSHNSPLLLLLSPLDYLIKQTGDENTVLRRQDGAATEQGLWMCPGLWAYCHGPHYILLSLVAYCLDNGLSMLCFGSKDLSCHFYPCALEHKRKIKNKNKKPNQTQNQTQTNPEERNRTCFLWLNKNPLLRREGRKPVFST